MASANRLILDLDGTSLTAAETLLLMRPEVSGVILFARNIESREQVVALTAAMRSVRNDLLICVDQEGGRVRRLRKGYTQLPPMAAIGALYERDPDAATALAHDTGWLLGMELLASGIDFSFAPVLDLDYGQSDVIGNRAFSADPEVVILLAGALCAGLDEAGVANCGKHYPGHGWVAADSHHELPRDERTLAAIEASDLRPFAALATKLTSIMPAHVVYSACDSEPAGFSAFWLNYLRSQLGFTGCIFSDDLAMEGAAVAGGFPARAAKAFAAGCDVVLVCNHRAGALEVADWLAAQSLGTPSSVRALAARQSTTWAALESAARYQRIREKLEALN